MGNYTFMSDDKTYVMKPIGYVRCPQLKTHDDFKKKPKGEPISAEAVLSNELAEAIDEIETFDHVWLIWVFDKNVGQGYKVKIYPHPDPEHQRGIFVTRTPFRPNPIGLSCVKVLGREGNILKFANSDIYDGTPILDIKPYIPSSDSRPDSKAGWISDLGL